jgi:hypothetical protein
MEVKMAGCYYRKFVELLADNYYRNSTELFANSPVHPHNWDFNARRKERGLIVIGYKEPI